MLGKPSDAANAPHRHVGWNIGWVKRSGYSEFVGADELDDDAVGIREAQHRLTEFARRQSRLEPCGNRAGEPEADSLRWYGKTDLESLADAVGRARTETAAGARRHRAVTRMTAEHWDQLHDLVERLSGAFAPMTRLEAGGSARPLSEIVTAHVAVAEAVARPAEAGPEDSSPLWDRDEGQAASLVLARLLGADTPQPMIRLADYPDFLRSLIGSESIRTRVPRHPRLFIWGPYEARLHQPDVVVLGSLNESVWPKTADPGPWLNRAMRSALGLPSPEEEVGRSAHDLTTLLGADTVYLTRADKVSGVPMVPSRWLLRLKALLSGLGLSKALEAPQPWLAWARARDDAPPVKPIDPPAPKPPVPLRPRRASVSDVETWLANPYAIFAKRILRLEALPPIGQEPGASERGQIVHEALARFTRAHPHELPDDIVGAFMSEADIVIGSLGREPRVRAFWRPRLQRFAEWFAQTEPARRMAPSGRLVEIDGRLVLDAPAGAFTLTARADRIDVEATGIAITDYKTGALPSDTEVLRGEAPQLPLEAAMAAAGVFPGVPANLDVTALRYIRATGGEPPGEERLVKSKDTSMAEVGRRAQRELESLIAFFDDAETPYRALRRRRFTKVYEFDDYAHLARIAEWAAGADGEDGP